MNLGSGAPTSVLTLASSLLLAAGFNVPIRVTGQYRVGDIRHCYADLTRARKWLGFEPRVPLYEGLRRFCAWAAHEPAHEDRSGIAAAELRAKGLAN